MLNRIYELTERLKGNSSTLSKIQILKEYPDLKELIYYIYNPYIRFEVTSDSCKKNEDFNILPDTRTLNILELLKVIVNEKVKGNNLMDLVNSYIFYHDSIKYQNIIYSIIDKDLKCGMSIKSINEVWKDLIPEFEVALGEQYKNPKDIDWSSEYFISRKMDGCRCLVFVNDDVKIFSRSGNEFETLNNIKDIFKNTEKGLMYDGEICYVDDNGNENFQEIMKLIRRKNFSINLKNIKFYVFDVLTVEEFNNKTGTVKLKDRWDRFNIKHDNVVLLNQVKLTEDSFIEWSKKVKDNGWEGLILRKNCGYKGKRSKNILKVKDFYDTEVKVVGMENDNITVIENGSSKLELMMSKLNCIWNGYKVDVGGGFSHNQRKYFMNNPTDIVGKIITVQYFEETINKEGQKSLRFPVFKGIVPTNSEGDREV